MSAINTALNGRFTDGYGNYPTLDKLNELTISLPTKNGKIDCSFMEEFAAELQAARVAELQAYLTTSGLSDYQLTAAEHQVLQDLERQDFGLFNVVDVFKVQNTGNILARDIVPDSGDIPYLGAGADNNSVSSYVSYDGSLEQGDCIFIGGKTFVVSYQKDDFLSNDSHNLALYLKDTKYKTKLNQLYMATCIYKSLGHRYSWGDSISNRKVQTDTIALPTKNNQPDFAAMETLISAVQKLVIQGVVDYADQKIHATEAVIRSKSV